MSRVRSVQPPEGFMEELPASSSPWWEDEEMRAERIARRLAKRRQFCRVCSVMGECVTAVEREALVLHFVVGLKYEAAGQVLGRNPSSVYRAVVRGVRKLRAHFGVKGVAPRERVAWSKRFVTTGTRGARGKGEGETNEQAIIFEGMDGMDGERLD